MRHESWAKSAVVFADADGTRKTLATTYQNSDPVHCQNVMFVDFMVDYDKNSGSLVTFGFQARDVEADAWYDVLTEDATGALSLYEVTITPSADQLFVVSCEARGNQLRLRIKDSGGASAEAKIRAIGRVA